jgi:hypothetical protein
VKYFVTPSEQSTYLLIKGDVVAIAVAVLVWNLFVLYVKIARRGSDETRERRLAITSVANNIVAFLSLLSVNLQGGAEPLINQPGMSGTIQMAFNVFDCMRLVTLAPVAVCHALVFLAAELHRSMNVDLGDAWAVGSGLCLFLLCGWGLPLVLATAIEAHLRHSFLVHSSRPISELGPFWGPCWRATSAVTGTAKRLVGTCKGAVAALPMLHLRQAM